MIGCCCNSPKQTTMAVRALSINIHGIRGSTKCQNVFLWLNQQQQHIFFLQETYFSCDEDIKTIKDQWPGKAYFSYGSKHSRGVGILIKKSLNCTVSKVSRDKDRRWIRIILSMVNSRLQLLNIYAPCPVGERAAFFDSLLSHLIGGIPTIVGDDFNTAEDLYLDKIGSDSQPGRSAQQSLNSLILFASLTCSDLKILLHAFLRGQVVLCLLGQTNFMYQAILLPIRPRLVL